MLKLLMQMRNTVPTRDRELWEKAAEDFITFVRSIEKGASGDFLRKNLLFPTIIKHLCPLSDRRVLDAGCGEGLFSQELEKQGAEVVGIDISPIMIKAAQQRKLNDHLILTFQLASIEEKDLFPSETFDVVVVNMVFQEMASIEEAFQNLLVYLKPQGKIVISILHPAFDMNDSQKTALGLLSQGNLDHGRWTYGIFSPYAEARRHERNYTFSENPVAYYFRPVQDYVNLMIRNDVVLSGFYEPTLSKKEASVNQHIAHAYFVPRFLVLGGEKR